MQNTSRKKSSESSDQPKKDARNAWRCEGFKLRKLLPMAENDPTDIRRSIPDRSFVTGVQRARNICCNNYSLRASYKRNLSPQIHWVRRLSRFSAASQKFSSYAASGDSGRKVQPRASRNRYNRLIDLVDRME